MSSRQHSTPASKTESGGSATHSRHSSAAIADSLPNPRSRATSAVHSRQESTPKSHPAASAPPAPAKSFPPRREFSPSARTFNPAAQSFIPMQQGSHSALSQASARPLSQSQGPGSDRPPRFLFQQNFQGGPYDPYPQHQPSLPQLFQQPSTGYPAVLLPPPIGPTYPPLQRQPLPGPAPVPPMHDLLSRFDNMHYQIQEGTWSNASAAQRRTRSEVIAGEFTYIFGTDTNDLNTWQRLCYVCGVKDTDVPHSIDGCREVLHTKYCNVFDIVGAGRNNGTAWDAGSAQALAAYSRDSGKILSFEAAKVNNFLRFMLKKFE